MKSTAFGQLRDLLRPYRKAIVVGVILSLLPAYFTVWGPYLIGQLIDIGVVGGRRDALVQLALLFLGVQCALFFTNTFTTYALRVLGLNLLVDYRSQLLEKILSYRMDFFDKISAGRLSTRLNSDINSLESMVSSALVSLIGNGFLILGVMIGMLLINWPLALIAFAVIPLLIWLTLYFHTRIRRRYGFVRKKLSSLNSFAGESFDGNRDLRVMGARDFNEHEFGLHSARLRNRSLEAAKESGIYGPMIHFLSSLMVVLILASGSWFVMVEAMTVGEVVAFLTYANYFAWPLYDFAEKYTLFQRALASVDRLVEISTHPSERDEGNHDFFRFSKIEFQELSFSYSLQQEPAVRNLNFEVSAREKIALLGETGSGKSTTCSLLMRFYDPQSGSLLFDGVDAQKFSLESYRKSFGWVSQDVTLFSTTVRENLRFYEPSIRDEDLWECLEWVQLRDWVKSLPGGLDEILSERASTVSSGQRQLISLARAIVRRPRVLILDEATAYVDSETEEAIQKALERLWSLDQFLQITGFFIAHRLSTLQNCDRMLVFKEGQIVESGSFEELMHLDGYGASLYKRQFRLSA